MHIMMLSTKAEPEHVHLHEVSDIHHKMMECISHVLENHPHTWDAYKDEPYGCDKIINMEIGELECAKRTKDFYAQEKEYMHAACAFLHAWCHIVKNQEKMKK